MSFLSFTVPAVRSLDFSGQHGSIPHDSHGVTVTMEKRVLIRVYGLVQGVGFRMFVERSASRLGLSGWVRNMPDGTVQIDVQGPVGLVEELLDDAKIGPPASKVSSLDVVEKQPDCTRNSFDVLL
jgi:acylphosphatase